MNGLGPVLPATTLSWFPLVGGRQRPPGLPLQTRIAELADLAAGPARGTSHERASWAAEVCNKAALIASDCGVPPLARALCYRQYELYEQADPLPGWAIKLALQPILNIPRQLIREGDGQAAYATLETLLRSAKERTSAVIGARTVDLNAITRTAGNHKTVVTLVWAALLSDGTRALALAGRWQEAADHAAEHRGVGRQLLDGRQAAILAHIHQGSIDEAAAMVEHSTIVAPWEHTVQSLLRVLCLPAPAAVDHHRATMLAAARALAQEHDPLTAVMRTRAGMIALELAADFEDSQVSELRESVLAAASRDAYAARDVLAHPQIRAFMTDERHRDFDSLVRSCGFGTGTIPPELHGQLTTAVERAESALRAALSG